MMGLTAASGTKQAGACASFFVATPTNHAQLGHAHTWATNVVNAVNDRNRAQVGLLVSLSALLNQLRIMQDQIAVNQPTQPLARFGLWNSPTVILLAPALSDGSGIVLYGREGSAAAVTLSNTHLGALSLADVRDPWERKAVVTSSSDPQTRDAAVLLDFLRRSSYVALYLLPVISGANLGGFAGTLGRLTDMSVYWNTSPLVFETKGNALQPPSLGVAGIAAHGADQVALAANDTSSFLPGSQERVL